MDLPVSVSGEPRIVGDHANGRALLMELGHQLHDRLSMLGADVLAEGMARVIAGETLTARAQPDEGVSYAHKLDKAEARLDFTRPAIEVERQVRAFIELNRPVLMDYWNLKISTNKFLSQLHLCGRVYDQLAERLRQLGQAKPIERGPQISCIEHGVMQVGPAVSGCEVRWKVTQFIVVQGVPGHRPSIAADRLVVREQSSAPREGAADHTVTRLTTFCGL